jgi:hypothetical protein
MFTVFQLLQPNVSVVVFFLFFCCGYGATTSNAFSDFFFQPHVEAACKQPRAAGACEQSSIAADACE